MSRRAVVGISTYVEPAQFGVWDTTAALIPYRYVEAVVAAGGRPVLLPPVPGIEEVVERLDAVVLAGGADVDPAAYGAERDPAVTLVRPERDAAEFALVRASRARDLPLLGVCRGMQLMAVEAGGTLVQHVPDLVGHDDHRPAIGVRGRHAARFLPGSLVGGLLGDALDVSSYHHQVVADPGRLTVTGWAHDDTIEALEEPGRRFALGVQWHPETEDEPRLFDALVAAAG